MAKPTSKATVISDLCCSALVGMFWMTATSGLFAMMRVFAFFAIVLAHAFVFLLTSDVTVVKLGSKPILKFGPLTILYVKEGQLGGAYSKNEGAYRLFAPGPPHILHEQVKTSLSCFLHHQLPVVPFLGL